MAGRPPRSAAAAAAAAAAIARASAPSSCAPPPSIPVTAAAAAPARAAAASAKPSARDHVVRLLTFNLWFEPLCMAARMKAIGGIVEKLRPAVIGFQETTRESLAMLRRQRWAQFYDCSLDTAPPFSEAYFVVLFSALPVLSLESMPFANTGMGRELLTAVVEVAPGRSLLVATAHLESMPQFKKERVAQLRQSLQFLSDRADAAGGTCLGALLMGDTNLLRGDMALLDPRGAAAELTIEAAPTGRAKCRKCGDAIVKGATRVGKTAKDRLPNGKLVEMTMWFHEDCFLADGRMTETEKRAVREAQAGGTTLRDAAAVADAQGEDVIVDRATLGLPPKWRDLWLSVGGNTEENGYTYDGRRNSMIKNRAYQSRLDRVYFYAGAGASCKAFEKIEMVGTAPIADGLWPSDHFGLLTTLCFDAVVKGARTDAKRKREEGEKEATEATRPKGSKAAPIELE